MSDNAQRHLESEVERADENNVLTAQVAVPKLVGRLYPSVCVDANSGLVRGLLNTPTINLGPFDLLRVISSGGMGQVYEGRHRESEAPVAIKIMHATTVGDLSHMIAFRDEAQAVASLDHPNIIRVFDYGAANEQVDTQSKGRIPSGSPYLVMEYIKGGSLSETKDAFGWPGLRRILSQLLDALAHSHAQGLIHRDIKPGNILLLDKEPARLQVKLTDFGIVHGLNQTMPQTNARGAQGTLHYMAPEQFRGKWREYGPWTDLYAVGVLAYEMATGHKPFEVDSLGDLVFAVLKQTPPPLRARFPVPTGFPGWVARLLKKSPRDRFHFAADARYHLDLVDPPYEIEVNPSGPQQAVRRSRIKTTPGGMLNLDRPPVLDTWRHKATTTGPGRMRGVGLGLIELRDLPLIGREKLRDRLWETFVEVSNTSALQVVEIHGPMGIGKSHLARWLTIHAQEVGAATLMRATHLPDKGPRHGLRPMLARSLRCLDAPPDIVSAQTQAAARWWDIDDPDWAANTARWLSPSQRAGMSGLFSPKAHHPLIKRFLSAQAQRRPAILHLEDIHCGADTLKFIDYLLSTGAATPGNAASLPVLVLMTARDEDTALASEEAALLARLRPHSAWTSLHLGPLPTDEHLAFVRQLLGLAPPLAARVAAHSEGNPMYAVQIVREWLQRGLLQRGDAGFRVPTAVAAPTLPTSLDDAWNGRLDELLRGLPPGSEEALGIAAILGMEVSLSQWQSACALAGIEPVFELVVALYTTRLAEPLETGWVFAHSMLRDCVLSRARRGESAWHRLNLACAEAVREGDFIDERLGRFLLDAGDPEGAITPLIEIAEDASGQGQHARALYLLDLHDRALKEATIPPHDPRWGRNLSLRATNRINQGNLEGATALAIRILEKAESPGWAEFAARAEKTLATIKYRMGDHDSAEAMFRLAAQGAAEVGARELQADCLRCVAHLRAFREDTEESLRLIAEGEALVRDMPGSRASLSLILTRGIVQKRQGDYDQAENTLKLAIDASRAAGYQDLSISAMNAYAGVSHKRRDYPKAETLYREVLALQESLGERSTVEVLNLAGVLNLTGRCVEAGQILEDAIDTIQEQGPRNLLASALLLRLPWRAHVRDWPGWEMDFSRAVEDAKARQHGITSLASTALDVGNLTLAEGAPDHARQVLEFARRLFIEMNDQPNINKVDGLILKTLDD